MSDETPPAAPATVDRAGQVLLAVAAVFVVGFVLGFVLGRTL